MSSNAPVKRAIRVAERIRAEVMDLLLRGAIRDPRASGATVTHVTVTDDLQHARVYVRLVEAEPRERRRREVVRALGSAAGFVRRELGKKLGTKYTPDVSFFWDDRVDSADRLERILSEIRDESRDEHSSVPADDDSSAPAEGDDDGGG